MDVEGNTSLNITQFSESQVEPESRWCILKKEAMLMEAKQQVKLALPLVPVNFLLYALSVISLMFVGHLGELPLSGAALASSFNMVTGFSVLMGMSSALETFSGQSFGAKEYRMVGIHLQRAMLVILLLCIPVATIFGFAGEILKLLGQDPQIAAEAGAYSRFAIPSLFPFTVIQCIIKVLMTQNDIIPMMITSGIIALLHIPICYLMVLKSGLGYKGGPLASAISFWIHVLLLVIYIGNSPSCKRTWTGFSKQAFHEVPNYLRLAVPSTIMICLEIWAFEILVLVAGRLPNPKLETSVLSISLMIYIAVYMIPTGLSDAVSTRVSNELGAGQADAARAAALVAVIMVVVQGILTGSVLIAGHNIWGYCYSKEHKIVAYVGQMMLLTAGAMFIDSFQTILTGILRGCGRQKSGAFVNIGVYCVVAMPCAWLLAFFYHLGGKGLFIGLIAALLAKALLLLIITWRINWDKEGKLAVDRVRDSSVH